MKTMYGEKKLVKRVLLGLWMASAGVLTPLISAAAASAVGDVMAEYTLDDVIVTASRTEKREVDTPAATKIVTAADTTQIGRAHV